MNNSPTTLSANILVVDDNHENLRLLAGVLTQRGHTVRVAPNGRLALTSVQAKLPDLILLDVMMPKMDGYQVCTQLKADERTRDVPVIFVSAAGEILDKVKAFSVGGIDYITKPFQMEEVLARVDTHVALHTAQKQLEGKNAQLEQQIAERIRAEEGQSKALAEVLQATHALEQHNQKLALLNRAGQELTATLDLQWVVEQLLHEVTEITGTAGASVWLWDEEREGGLICRAAYHQDLSRSLLNLRLQPGQGIVGWVAQTGESTIIASAPDSPHFFPGIDKQTGLHTTSLLAVPLRTGGEVIGVLEVKNKQSGDFDVDDRTLVETLAASAAIAIENARLHQQLQGHAEQLEQRVQERTAEVQTQYARLDTILNSTTDGIVVTDEGGEILHTNPIAQTWLTQALSPKDTRRLKEAVRDVATRADKRLPELLELTGLDLELRAGAISVPERISESEIGEVVVAIHDVSHLQEVDRMKTMFITNLSHELRTPIATIQSYAYLLQRTSPENEKWHEYLNALMQETDTQAQLSKDILQISRLYAGQVEINLHFTSLNELTEATISKHQTLAHEQGVTLNYYPTDMEQIVPVDHHQITQVLDNLVADSIRYTSKGGLVTVSTSRQEMQEQIWATISVSDTGDEMPTEDQSYVFERLFREWEPQSQRVSETGLRLMILKGVVELHRGRVTVENKTGVGPTFVIWLPLAN
ncbi:MAG: response regulator [Chloroflexi bacterium]|nr:response regulator [Chloroflexota bacterium]